MAIFVPISILLDRYRRSVKVSLRYNQPAETIATVLNEAFSDLRSAKKNLECSCGRSNHGLERNAGATMLNQRVRIYPGVARPICIRGKAAFPTIKLDNAELSFLPDAVLVISNRAVAALDYRDLVFPRSRYITLRPMEFPPTRRSSVKLGGL